MQLFPTEQGAVLFAWRSATDAAVEACKSYIGKLLPQPVQTIRVTNDLVADKYVIVWLNNEAGNMIVVRRTVDGLFEWEWAMQAGDQEAQSKAQ